MFEIFFSSDQVAYFQVTVAKLVTDVDEEYRLVEDNLCLNLSLNTFKLLYGFWNPVAVHETLSKARPCLNIVVDAKLKC